MSPRLVALPVLLALLAGTGAVASAAPAAAPVVAPPAPAAAVASAPLPDLDALDPVRYDYDDALVESTQVLSRDGLTQIWVDVVRPRDASGVPVTGLPTIMMASPYFNTLGRGYQGECKAPHQGPSFPTSPGGVLADCTIQTGFPEWYDEYFVPRGYAYVAMDLRGTRNSSGCQVYGDRDEVFDAVDVVDWIADQPWSNGKVGMTGGSYDGTIANGAAVEQPISGRHPDALAAIIPIRAIDRWYDYHFFNGVQSQSHAATPALFTAVLAGTDTQSSGTDDLLLPLHVAERKACIATVGAAVDAGYASPLQDADSDFWSERDFLKDVPGTRAAVFAIHGLYDFNVKTSNVGQLWEALPAGAPKKLWLLDADHADPYTPTANGGGHLLPFPLQAKYVEANHRWWLQFLKGVEAGALDTPTVEVQRGDGRFDAYSTWPAPAADRSLSLTPDGGLVTGTAPTGGVAYADGLTSDAPGSVSFTSAPYAEDTRISGQVVLDLLATVQGPDTTFAVELLDVPPGSTADDDRDPNLDADVTGPFTVSYGWLRAAYRDTVEPRGASTPKGAALLTPGSTTRFTFGSLPLDHVVPAGHSLAVVVSNSAGGTVPALTGETVTLQTGDQPGGAAGSRLLVPVAALEDVPPAEVPEVPIAVLLPLVALALGALVLRRGRSRTA